MKKRFPFQTLPDGRVIYTRYFCSYILPDEETAQKVWKTSRKCTVPYVMAIFFLAFIAVAIGFFKSELPWYSGMPNAICMLLCWACIPCLFFAEKKYVMPALKNFEKIETKINRVEKKITIAALAAYLLIIMANLYLAIFSTLELAVDYFSKKRDYKSALVYSQILQKHHPMLSEYHLFNSLCLKNKTGDTIGAKEDSKKLMVSIEKHMQKSCSKPEEDIDCYIGHRNKGLLKNEMGDVTGAKEDFEKFLQFYDSSPKLREKWWQNRDDIEREINELVQTSK